MKGNTKVIDALNMLLTGELTAMDQYLVHARNVRRHGAGQVAPAH